MAFRQKKKAADILLISTTLFGAGNRTLFSAIESSTGAFSQIYPAASCTKNLEFVSRPTTYAQNEKPSFEDGFSFWSW